MGRSLEEPSKSKILLNGSQESLCNSNIGYCDGPCCFDLTLVHFFPALVLYVWKVSVLSLLVRIHGSIHPSVHP